MKQQRRTRSSHKPIRKNYKWLESELSSKQPNEPITDSCTNPESCVLPDVDMSYMDNPISVEDTEISEFIKYCDSIVGTYEYAKSCIEHEQQYIQDILHMMEFSDDYKERYRLSTQLHRSRVKRRYYKDLIEVLDIVAKFISDPDTKRVINRLKGICGDIRKVKKAQAERVYHLRSTGENSVYIKKSGKDSE